MKSYSNTYIFIFATVMVIIVATLLTFVAETLRPYQEKNVEVEKKLDILRSVGLAAEVGEVDSKSLYVEKEYAENITKSLVINMDGEINEDVDAFTVNLKVELAKAPEDRMLPIFIYTAPDGQDVVIIPLQGKGLWGPIWGYVSFEQDMNTIFGAIFAHAKETPGLGAEISEDFFHEQFSGKKIFDEGEKFTSIKVLKGGTSPDDPHAVDAISGGTITSVALEEMLYDCLGNYELYFKNKSISHE
ncbi:MAG TPA: NADH:ubiquinone reductase (Na(+)-transporting) subunit C [Bacteroides sp.]|nr:NADH:ubiquinone reductase (Na(+)-transporting) subunit C [Bacteroides sp.]